MTIHCGVDLVEHQRISEQLNNRSFCARVFHPKELALGDVKKLAGIFALKEAVFKALDISSDHWLDVEVRYSKSGKPSVVLSPSVEPKGSFSVDCSVSHAGAYTVAVVIFLLQDKH